MVKKKLKKLKQKEINYQYFKVEFQIMYKQKEKKLNQEA